MTIEPQAFLNSLYKQLEVMLPQQQLAFGAICCERHMPDYLAFNAQENSGNPNVLRKAIDTAWKMIFDGRAPDEESLGVLLAECVEATPDADDFETVLVDYAQDAAIMVCHLINFIQIRDTRSLVSLASRARDLVDAKIQFTNQLDPADPALELKIANDPMMQAELTQQQASLREISQASSSQELAKLR